MTAERFSRIDRQLLLILKILLNERSVTRTAKILDQSPPAISLALRRLREMLGDPLLVRSGSRMVLTLRGERLLQPVTEALDRIDRIFLAEETFDPATAKMMLHLAAPSSLATFILPRLIERVRAEAPHISVVVRTIDPEYDYTEVLEAGKLDLILGDWPHPPDTLRMSPLLENEICCLLRADHFAANPDGIDLEVYLQLNHLSPALVSSTYLGPIGARLAELGLRRRVAMTIPEFNLAPFLLLRSDLVLTTARCFCEFWASVLPLLVVPAPAIFKPMRFYLLWHERSHNSAHVRWLRTLLREIALDLGSGSTSRHRMMGADYQNR